VEGDPLVGKLAGIAAGRRALVGAHMPQPPETMQTSCKLDGRQFEGEGRFTIRIENTASQGETTAEDLFGDERINGSQICRSNNHTAHPETAALKGDRLQDSTGLPQTPPAFGDVKRHQSGAIFDSHTVPCCRIMMIPPFRLSGPSQTPDPKARRMQFLVNEISCHSVMPRACGAIGDERADFPTGLLRY
jgi:hypothetical protein